VVYGGSLPPGDLPAFRLARGPVLLHGAPAHGGIRGHALLTSKGRSLTRSSRIAGGQIGPRGPSHIPTAADTRRDTRSSSPPRGARLRGAGKADRCWVPCSSAARGPRDRGGRPPRTRRLRSPGDRAPSRAVALPTEKIALRVPVTVHEGCQRSGGKRRTLPSPRRVRRCSRRTPSHLCRRGGARGRSSAPPRCHRGPRSVSARGVR
jgi:hypothetical protein